MNKMIYAGIAVLVIVVLAFFMFRKKGPEEPIAVNPTPALTATTSAPTAAPIENNTMGVKSLPKPELTINSAKRYSAVLKTSEGDITIELDAVKTPITANNFVYLSRNNFYDNTIFHRVLDGFMIQGGDPTGTGMGSPGYRFEDEPIDGAYSRGTVAMANSGPNTNGSQFFIMHADYALPKNYVIFGKVTSGIEVVDKIATAPTTPSAMGENSKPVNPVTINSVDIQEQ